MNEMKTIKALEFRIASLEQQIRLLTACDLYPNVLQELEHRWDELVTLLDYICEDE